MIRRGSILLVLWLLCCCACAHASSCAGPFPVAYRTLPMSDGREVSVWYPVQSGASSGSTEVPVALPDADRAPIATCSHWPLVLFSHGLAGCATQVVFVTEQIARQGYVVVAPNHHDALCGKDVEGRKWQSPGTTQPPFLEPGLWDEHARRDRMLDLREALQLVVGDADLGRAIDATHVGLMGHSLGGYTVLGVAGGWSDWGLPGVRAVLGFSPYVAPFLLHRRLSRLRVPVMYQGGTLDFGITPSVERDGGAYAQSPAPKFFLDLQGATHMAWTNWPCRDEDTVAGCLADVPNARLIDAYALAFLDHYLKDRPAPLLEGHGEGLAAWRMAR